MQLSVKVKPAARKEGISVTPEGVLEVRVSAPPEKGKANERLIELLAEHFGVPKSRVSIVAGHTQRLKIVEIQSLEEESANS